MDKLRALVAMRGFFTRAEAFAEGYDDKSIARALRNRLWVRVRVGAYTLPEHWEAVDPSERHLIRAHAVLHRLGDSVALSHTSAALDHGLSLWDPDLSLVHVTRLDGAAGRTQSGVQHHEGFCVPSDLERRHGHLVVNAARAALETASISGDERGVVVLDSYLHRGGSRELLEATYPLLERWPHSRSLQIPIRLADGGAESAGESRGRYLLYTQHIPMPELQYEVRDRNGVLLGTCDFGWPAHHLLGEFDGKVKYGRLLRPGEDAGDAVFREKVREDRLREATGWGMVRLVWADLATPAATAARVRRLLGRHAA
ncbi:MAG: type IV toxin-antitoxin system AbiEi family antitoxin domain-containing protein [Nocardioidaceae bacterium]